MKMDNDTRGWVLTGISAVACIFGAGFICIDIIVRLFPGKRGFKIQDSNAFLSCSLSLSAGVMLFSALYKILPEAKNSLTTGGYSASAAAWVLIVCFLAGVWGIQLLSKLVRMCIPSQVVGCDHSHGEGDVEDNKVNHKANGNGTHESSPLLPRPSHTGTTNSRHNSMDSQASGKKTPKESKRRPLVHRMSRTFTSLVTGEKSSCNEDGPCRGYTKPCGANCFRTMGGRHGVRSFVKTPHALSGRPNLRRSVSTTAKDTGTLSEGLDYQDARSRSQTSINEPRAYLNQKPASQRSRTLSPSGGSTCAIDTDDSHNTQIPTSHPHSQSYNDDHDHIEDEDHQHDLEGDNHDHDHHHHVPTNAFLSLSFQTSVGIVLHKLPEGFITYASNHANPTLGFNIFMALAIHNVTEGFALALPIYLATNSRAKALLYSFIMGGFSQPLGAAVAALWLKLAEKGKGDFAPSQGMYGGLFAATAGILANVALNLLSESWELSHHKGLCMFFVFVGMGILGISGALSGS